MIPWTVFNPNYKPKAVWAGYTRRKGRYPSFKNTRRAINRRTERRFVRGQEAA